MGYINFEHVCKYYQTGDTVVKAVDDVNFTVEKGEFCVLLGPSGSGKSTLLNILGGIDRADSGDILIDGERMADMNEKALTLYRRRHLGYIFQMYNLIPNLTVRENIEVGAYLSRRPLDVDELLHLLGLWDHRGKLPNQLSGGQQQRVSIARALVRNPPVILADEPTGALDSHTGREVLGLLQQLHKQGHTVVLITHDNSIAVQADRIIRLEDGQVVYDGDSHAPEAMVQPTLLPETPEKEEQA